jgi:hypothetical protein
MARWTNLSSYQYQTPFPSQSEYRCRLDLDYLHHLHTLRQLPVRLMRRRPVRQQNSML